MSVLSLILMGASCEVVGDPDAVEVTAVLEDCVADDIESGSGVETCVITSSDPRANGSWEFRFDVFREDHLLVYQGSVSIKTSSGSWEGEADRVVTDSGAWKGGADAGGVDGYQDFFMSLGGEEQSFDGSYRLTGQITPND